METLAGPLLDVPVAPPYRLDLTVAALQRLRENPVEVWTEDGHYLRAFETPAGPVAWEVTQPAERALALRLHGEVRDVAPWAALLRRMLGCDVELAGFHEAARRIPALAPLAGRLRGLRPPRFSTLWEALVNGIAFQQISLAAGTAILGRLTARCTRPVHLWGQALRPFPGPASVRALRDSTLRACGFSAAKARALRAAAAAILDGTLREEELELLPEEEIAARLGELPGVGPWTAALVLLRGLGRLASFPAGDSGATRRFRAVFGDVDPAELLVQLGPWRGMLYFHLLLAGRGR